MGNCWAQQQHHGAAVDKHQVEKQRQHQDSCVFCRIAKGSEKARTVYQDDQFVVFADRSPAAKVHLLVVPHAHIRDVNHLGHSYDDLTLVCKMHELGSRLLREQEPDSRKHKLGYHVPPWISVPHLHLHAFALPHIMGKGIKYRLPGVWLPAEALERRLTASLHQQGIGLPSPSAAADVERGQNGKENGQEGHHHEGNGMAASEMVSAGGMDRNGR